MDDEICHLDLKLNKDYFSFVREWFRITHFFSTEAEVLPGFPVWKPLENEL